MKTFQQFTEEISPKRMAELDAKGKGDAARAKAAADQKAGLENKVQPKPQTKRNPQQSGQQRRGGLGSPQNQQRVGKEAVGRERGGALAVQPTSRPATTKSGPGGGKGTETPGARGRSGALVPQNNKIVPTSNYKEPRASRPDETKTASRPGTSKGRYQTPVPDKSYSSLKEPTVNKPKPDNRRRNRTIRKYAGKAFKAFTKPGKSGEDVQDGQEAGNVSGGAEYTSRTKRG